MKWFWEVASIMVSSVRFLGKLTLIDLYCKSEPVVIEAEWGPANLSGPRNRLILIDKPSIQPRCEHSEQRCDWTPTDAKMLETRNAQILVGDEFDSLWEIPIQGQRTLKPLPVTKSINLGTTTVGELTRLKKFVLMMSSPNFLLTLWCHKAPTGDLVKSPSSILVILFLSRS